MSNQIPERLINFAVYVNGHEQIGIADAELPELEAMTDTVTGAGIGGEIDSPTMGHFGSMSLSLTWRAITGNATALAAQKAHAIELRGAQQIHDTATGEYLTQRVRVVVRAAPKRFGLGSFEVAATTGTESEFEVTYLKLFINDREVLELDKYNFVYRVGGVDYLDAVARALGKR